VRRLPGPTDGLGRVETGPIQIGEDWPGLFIRGDSAFGLAMSLKAVLTYLEEHPDAGRQVFFAVSDLKSLYKLIIAQVIIGAPEICKAKEDQQPPKLDIEV